MVDHLENGLEHTDDCAVGTVLAFSEPAQTVEVTEEFVGAVDEVNDPRKRLRLTRLVGGPRKRLRLTRFSSRWAVHSDLRRVGRSPLRGDSDVIVYAGNAVRPRSSGISLVLRRLRAPCRLHNK